jgi:hypothetical protein
MIVTPFLRMNHQTSSIHRKADIVEVAAWRLYRGGESATVPQDLYRAFRPYPVKHDPGEILFNDPVTVFHI